jgi:hypothetical protein
MSPGFRSTSPVSQTVPFTSTGDQISRQNLSRFNNIFYFFTLQQGVVFQLTIFLIFLSASTELLRVNTQGKVSRKKYTLMHIFYW